MDVEERNSSRPGSSEHSNPDPSEEPSEDQLEEYPPEEAAKRPFLIEGEPLPGETEEIIAVGRLLENYKEGNEDIRETLSHQLSTTGLLLTLSLGTWYFVMSGSSRLPIYPKLLIPILFTLTLLLIVSITCGIEAINKKINPLAISTIEELYYTKENYGSKRWWSTASIWSLRAAFILILVILIFFAWECLLMNTTANPPVPAHLSERP